MLEIRKEIAPRLLDFEKQGDLTIVDLPNDIGLVAEKVVEIDKSGILAMIGMDPERTHRVIKAALNAAGIEDERITGVGQGWRLVGPITVAERRLADGTLEHCASPLMAWCAGNAKVVPKGNAVSIEKQTSGNAKIDPLMATFNAVELMARNPEGTRSFWETARAAA